MEDRNSAKNDAEVPRILDRTGERVRYICKSGKCPTGRSVVAALKRSDHPLVQPIPGGQRQHYAGHIAICERCGHEWKDFYNWSPA